MFKLEDFKQIYIYRPYVDFRKGVSLAQFDQKLRIGLQIICPFSIPSINKWRDIGRSLELFLFIIFFSVSFAEFLAASWG